MLGAHRQCFLFWDENVTNEHIKSYLLRFRCSFAPQNETLIKPLEFDSCSIVTFDRDITVFELLIFQV